MQRAVVVEKADFGAFRGAAPSTGSFCTKSLTALADSHADSTRRPSRVMVPLATRVAAACLGEPAAGTLCAGEGAGKITSARMMTETRKTRFVNTMTTRR